MDYKYKRSPKRRITGRFYAFLTVVVVLCVMLGVFVNARGKTNANANLPYQPVAYQTEPTPTPSPDVGIVAPEPSDQTGTSAEPTADPAVDETSTVVAVGDDIELPPLEAKDMVVVESLSARTDLPTDWRNILLLGSDTRNMKKVRNSRTDTIIIASINTVTGDVRLASLMRDMMIEIPGKGMHKINDVNYYGGPELVMKLINEKLGMNITEYVLVNFAGIKNVVDKLDGIYLDITEKEKDEINSTLGDAARFTMDKDEYLNAKDAQLLTTHGKNMLLSGLQTLAYARIRSIDSDYTRTQRQRKVIIALANRVKGVSAIKLTQIATGMWGQFETNINMINAVGLAANVLQHGLSIENIKDWRMPGSNTYATDSMRNGVSAIYDIDYPQNARLLHRFIYGTEFD